MTKKAIKGLKEIYNKYDVFFIDLWGVIHNGIQLYSEAIEVLENLYKQIKLHHNWSFWNIRDSRTLFSLMDGDPRKEINFAAHNALADAIVQSLCIQKVYKKLNL